MNKAPRVCLTCKTRKKACDKCLPKCGYCAKRDLVCTYDESSASESPVQYGYPFLNEQTGPVPDIGLPGFLDSDKQMTVDDMIYDQLRRIVSLTGTSIPQMIEQFSSGVHNVFPVISAEALRTQILAHQDRVLPADFGLVILSMYLLTMRALDDSRRTESISSEAFYVTIKMLLGHVQALDTSSLYLVQACLLLAAFEYACCQPYAAYLSIGICGRMAVIFARRENRHHKNISHQSLREALGENLFWGVVFLERLVACEIDIPLESSLINQVSAIFQRDNKHMSMDGEQQALGLLGKVLVLTKSMTPFNLEDLQKASADLQDYLSAALVADNLAWRGAPYVSIAIAIRSLFLLHQYILNEMICYPNQSEELPVVQISLNALNTATRIMIDTSRDHVDHGIPHDLDTFPLCGGYNLRCAMKHLREYGTRDSHHIAADLTKLERLYSAFCQRWKPLGKPY